MLTRFQFDPTTSELARKIHIAAWLHDTVEDTDVTLDEIRDLFGSDVAKIVDAVTKVTPNLNSSSAEDGLATILKIKQHPYAILVKLADRIANVEWGQKTGTVLQKYFREYPPFRETLKEDGIADAMWSHLDSILNSK